MLLESAALDGGPDEMQSPATELSTALDSPSPLPVGPYAFLGSLEAIGHFGREPSTAVEADGVPLTGEWAAAAHVRGSRQQPQRTGKQPRKRNYDPNKARSEQLRELQRLRVEAATLEVKLQQLQTGRNGSSRSIQHQSSSHSGEGDGSGLPAVWEDIYSKMQKNAMTKALVKFVVSATAASISTSNEAMENLLVDEALQTCS
ncbi:hypothetical protein PHYPSEUDO_002646 [Phytophthora pseudosyringae]|uniref:Uncharacterized protein n=1 Tax=Phytophthora pseudosyringae TaxID=221518 RepID=A0A8T1VSR4_9STRA|nr:hypothetical protein PHYPSEUDO_002646 [Phytophthora pseudosyringae]